MNKKQLNPVEYAIFLQRAFLISLGISFVIMILLMVLLDPTINIFYIYAFLILLFVFFLSGLSLLSFWWVFSIKKEILVPYQVNQLVAQSSVSAIVILSLVVLNQTKLLNVWSIVSVFLIYGLYQIWIHSNSKD